MSICYWKDCTEKEKKLIKYYQLDTCTLETTEENKDHSQQRICRFTCLFQPHQGGPTNYLLHKCESVWPNARIYWNCIDYSEHLLENHTK